MLRFRGLVLASISEQLEIPDVYISNERIDPLSNKRIKASKALTY